MLILLANLAQDYRGENKSVEICVKNYVKSVCIHTHINKYRIVHENPHFGALSTSCINNKNIGNKVKGG